MADSENTQGQVTSKIPTTRPEKNPNRVAAGKAVTAKTKQVHEEQKKVLKSLWLRVSFLL